MDKLKLLLSDLDVNTNIFYGFLSGAAFLAGLPFLGILSPLLLMIGSAVHHYYGTRFTAYLDWIPIYMVFAFLLSYSLFPLPQAAAGWMIIVMISSYLDIATKGESRKIAVGVIGAGLLATVAFKWGFDPLMKTSFQFALAFIPWKIGEDIRSVKQKETNKYRMYHGMWHILTAYAIWNVYKLVFEVDLNHLNSYILM